MKPRPYSSLGAAVPLGRDIAPTKVIVVEMGDTLATIQLADGSILRGVRVVGGKPAAGASVWIAWDAAGRPYIMNAGGDGSGGGGGVTITGGGVTAVPLTAHALSDTALHTGTLADAQATQFLLLDGTRDLEGYLGFLDTALNTVDFTVGGNTATIESDGDVIRVLARHIEAAQFRGGSVDAPLVTAELVNSLGVQTQNLRIVPDHPAGFDDAAYWGGMDIDSDALWIDTSLAVVAIAKPLVVHGDYAGGIYLGISHVEDAGNDYMQILSSARLSLGVTTGAIWFYADGAAQHLEMSFSGDGVLLEAVGTGTNYVALKDRLSVTDGTNYVSVYPHAGGVDFETGSTSKISWFDGILYGGNGIRTRTTAGAPTGGASGDIAIDTTNSRVYCNVSGTWKYAALT